MGTRGPRKKSREDQEARGNPGHRSLDDVPPETEIDLELPQKPDDFADDAAKYWDEIIPRLISMGTVHRIDGFALRVLCDYMGEYRECRRKINKEGSHIELSNRVFQERKEVKQAREAMKMAKPLLDLFGLHTKSRSGMNIVIKRKKLNTGGDTSKKAKHGF